MDFRIDCQCGLCFTVTEASAGGTVDCPCGRAVSVPSLKELRLRAGLPPYNISPETVIEQLLATSQLPGSKTCVRCGADTSDIIHVVTECERSWTHREGGFSWMTLLVTALFFPIALWLWVRKEEKEYGKDKVYALPLPLCRACEPAVRGRKALKQCLMKIPDYSRLLEKFPDARLTVQK